MIFGLAITSTVEISNKSGIINSLSDELEAFFEERNYGQDVKSYTIGVVCVAPQFEQFFKEKKPKYTKGKKTITEDGIPFTFEDSLEYSIKLDFETFKNATEEGTKLLAKEILQSLSVLDDMKKKIKDFDSNQFKEDITAFFLERKLI